jgi:hypothetical protein
MPTTPDDLAAAFSAMQESLKAAPQLRVDESTHLELPEETNTLSAVVADLKKYAKTELSSALQHCFFPFARFSIYWETAGGGPDLVWGEMALTYLYNVASRDPSVVTPHTPEAERELLHSLRVIDDQPTGGNGTFAAIRREGSTLQSDVWFFDIKRGTHRLDVDYCGYLYALLDTKGCSGWQYLFADIDLSAAENRGLLARLRRMLKLLPELFPDRDYAPLAERLADRTRRRPGR